MKLSSRKVLSVMRRALTPNRPYHAQWMLTRRCNYCCRGCNVWRNQENLEELSTDEVKKGLDVLQQLGVMELVLSGGNPLLREDIDEIIDYASQFFITTVYDNGSLALKKIDALRNADFVAISLDTLDAKKNDYIKGVSGAWKKAVEAVETLREEGIFVGVSPTISQLNLHEIINFTKYFTDHKVPVWYCLYWYDQPVGDKLFEIGKKINEFEIRDRGAIGQVCDELMAMKKERQGVFITTKTLVALKRFFLERQRTWKCGALQSFFVVDHMGRVAGCHCREPVALVYELADVWDSPRFEDF
ncbi:MAG: radical SAM protein, partial [Candidatus Bathyarchaeota archaeon]